MLYNELNEFLVVCHSNLIDENMIGVIEGRQDVPINIHVYINYK